jgi:hypothetical protein
MRIWSIHPRYLDRQGILALWREALLAQKVLLGRTKGYRNHPQLERFRAHEDPVGAIGFYLSAVHDESVIRGYRFDRSKIVSVSPVNEIEETVGQIAYEREHLLVKLRKRDRDAFDVLKETKSPEPHPLFRLIRGSVRSWERTG